MLYKREANGGSHCNSLLSFGNNFKDGRSSALSGFIEFPLIVLVKELSPVILNQRC